MGRIGGATDQTANVGKNATVSDVSGPSDVNQDAKTTKPLRVGLAPKRSKIVSDSAGGTTANLTASSMASLRMTQKASKTSLRTEARLEELAYIKTGLMNLPKENAIGPARLLIRRTSKVDGQARTMIAGTVMGKFTDSKHDELWDAEVLFVPYQKLKTMSMFGLSMDQTLIHPGFADPTSIDTKEKFRQNPDLTGRTDAAIAMPARFFLRDMSTPEVERTMLTGLALEGLVAPNQKADEIWTGEVYIVPVRKRAGDDMKGHSADGLMTSFQLSDPTSFGELTYGADSKA